MMIIQWSFLVLTLVQIHASKFRSIRQTAPNSCPDVAFCDFIQCENGRCVDDKTSTDCFKCVCEAGFTGQLCETAIVTASGCNPSCQNGGQCEQTSANTFVCVCPPGFTGSQCETHVLSTHVCVTMPTTVCQNGGTCTQNGDEYLCNCAAGWSGKNCQTQGNVTQCQPDICGAHGTCIQAVSETGTIIFCHCESKWTGDLCEIYVDDNDKCPVGFCQSGGTCVTIGNMPTCQCPPTHTGLNCETLIGTTTTTTLGTVTQTPGNCATRPCLNGGSCYNTGDSYFCFCGSNNGFTGKNCETLIGTTTMITPTTPMITTVTGTTTTTTGGSVTQIPGNCATRPCLNGGSCFNTGNNFICLCNQQWTGATCAISNAATVTTTPSSSDPCVSNPCSNGGACFKQTNLGFVCVCTSAFTGPTCTISKTTTPAPTVTGITPIKCENRPCQNGGTCYNTGDSYFCFCGSKNGFTGKNCETLISSPSANCPLNCSPGHCVSTSSNQNTYACMCNGILNPTSCPAK